MKTRVIFLLILVLGICFSFIPPSDSSKELIGTWGFVELLEINGSRIDTLHENSS